MSTSSAASAGSVVGTELLTLAPRPEPPADVLAAITAAAQMVWPQPSAPDEQDPVHQTWRF
ncbi:MAG TPA: hypothetical protein VGF87_11115, partial [Acidimicrobiales bacterium]